MRSPLAIATLAVAVFRILALAFLSQPGYTDAFYYFIAARRLAGGDGLTTDVVWNFIEAPGFVPLPIPSHRFWMPLASALQALGVAGLGGAFGALRSAQLLTALVAIAITPATYLLARRLGAPAGVAALVAFVAGVGGVAAPAWSSLDHFAPLAVLGTLLLASLPGVAAGRRRDTVMAGLALGGIALSRADGLLYALAPLALVRARPRATAVVLGIAFLMMLPWELRQVALGTPDSIARAALLVRYEDFFRIAPPTLDRYLASLDVALGAKGDALVSNALTFVLASFVVLGPLALIAAWRRRGDPIARGWLVVAIALFLTQSLVFTLHSTRGSFSHSLAGLVPGAIALGIMQGAALVPSVRGAAAYTIAVAATALSLFALVQWRDAFGPDLAARQGHVASGAVAAPMMAANAAAWRYVVDGPALVTPADGLDAAREVARRYGVRTFVLEAGHFSAYDALYDGRESVEWLQPVSLDGPIRVWRVRQ